MAEKPTDDELVPSPGSRTVIDAAMEAARRLHGSQIVEMPLGEYASDPMLVQKDGSHQLPFAIVPDGRKLVPLAEHLDVYRARPRFPTLRQTVAMRDLRSFIAYIRAFRADLDIEPETGDEVGPIGVGRLVVYGTHAPIALQAVLDHAEDAISPTFNRSLATFEPILAETWKAWTAINGKELQQADLAEFLEDHIAEVAHIPDGTEGEAGAWRQRQEAQFGVELATPSTLLQVAGHLQVNVGRSIVNRPSLADGQVHFEFKETHETATAGGVKVAVPKAFAINVPMHVNGAAYLILARLRYRMAGDKVVWKILLHRLDLVADTVFAHVCDEVEAATGVRPLLGARSTA